MRALISLLPLFLATACARERPTITVEQLAGSYKSGECLGFKIQGDKILLPSGESASIRVKRIKGEDFVDYVGLVVGDTGCAVVKTSDPLLLPISWKDGRANIRVVTQDLGHEVAFEQSPNR